MFSLPVGHRGGKAIAVADVGSGSAGVAVIIFRPGQPARIHALKRCSLPFEERTQKQTISGILAALAEAGESASTMFASSATKKHARVSEVYAIVRAPWTHSKTIRAVSDFPQPLHIEGSAIATLAKEALGKDTQFDPSTLLEASVVRVELNGYATGHPVGKSAEHIAVSTLISDCDPRIRAGVIETLTRIFPSRPPLLRSGTRAILSVLRECARLPQDCFVVNMTSEATTLIAVRKGVAAQQTFVPEGARTIVRRIAADTMPEETLALIKMASKDQSSDEASAAINESLARIEPALVRVFGEGMARLGATRRIPNTLVMCVPEDLAPWLQKFFSRIDFTQFTMTTQPLIPDALTLADLSAHIAYEEGVKHDPGLAVASALVNIEQGSAK